MHLNLKSIMMKTFVEMQTFSRSRFMTLNMELSQNLSHAVNRLLFNLKTPIFRREFLFPFQITYENLRKKVRRIE